MKVINKPHRIIFRELINEDASQLFEIYADKEAMRYRGSQAMNSLQDAINFINNQKLEEATQLTIRKGIELNDKLIGSIMYRYKKDVKDKCEIGYSIGKKYWGKGLGKEIVTKMLSDIKIQDTIKQINAWSHKNNIASIKILESLKFEQKKTIDNKYHLYELKLPSDKIIVVDYTEDWLVQFEALRNVLFNNLKDDIVGIEHVGSTSVKGMKAKPIIDLDIIISKDGSSLNKVIAILDKLGYVHVGNLGITGREAFKRKDEMTPNTGNNQKWFKHNLYVCMEGSLGLQNHLNLRDYLNKHPEKVVEYSLLKENLAKKFPYDINAYIDGKTDFIVAILCKTGIDNNETKLITQENKISK